jgi:hypothetical protein
MRYFEGPGRFMQVMRSIVLVALVLVEMCAAAGSADARSSARGCAPAHAELIVSNRQAQVYSAIGSEGFPEVFGCVRPGGRPRLLGFVPSFGSQGGTGTSSETLAGTTVAYQEVSSEEVRGVFVHSSKVYSYSLRKGRKLLAAPTGTPSVPGSQNVGVGPAVSLLVAPSGSLAWIVKDTEVPGTSTYQVHALGNAGGRLLASGNDIDPRSLSLREGKLSWTQAGARSAVPFS